MKVLELFGGIGACTSAIKRLKIPYEVIDYVEIDKHAVASYNAMNGTNFEPQDVCLWDKDVDVDLIMHGSPCQDFSLAGNNAGGDKGSGTRSSLMYETVRIVEKLRPKYVIWENVKNLLSKKHKHNFENYLYTLEGLGYKNFYKVLNAKDYGIPQNRERIFTISILGGGDFIFPEKQPLQLTLKDMLENDVDEKYYLSKETSEIYQIDEDESMTDNKSLKIKNATQLGYIEARNGDSVNLSYPNSKTRRGRVGKQIAQTLMTVDNMGVVSTYSPYVNKKYQSFVNEKGYVPEYFNPYNVRELKDLAPTLTAQGDSVTKSGTVLKKEDYRIRKLTPKECWRLMGFSDEDFEKAANVNSNSQLYKQAGNSIVVDVLVGIFENLFKGDARC